MSRNVRKVFKGLKKDAQHTQVHTGNSVRMVDASGTPKESPYSFDTSIASISVPSDAAEVVLRPSVDMRVGVDDDLSDGYFVIPANVPYPFGLADEDTLYFRGDTESGVLNFYFVII